MSGPSILPAEAAPMPAASLPTPPAGFQWAQTPTGWTLVSHLGAPPAPAAPASWAQPVAAPAPVASWSAAPQPAAVPQPLGVLVPLNLQGGDGGKVKVMLQFGPEYAEPSALRALLGALVASNAPLDVWYPKQDNGRGGRRGGSW